MLENQLNKDGRSGHQTKTNLRSSGSEREDKIIGSGDHARGGIRDITSSVSIQRCDRNPET